MFEGYIGRRRLKTLIFSIMISLTLFVLISCWKNLVSPTRTRLKLRKSFAAQAKHRSNQIPFLSRRNIFSSIEFTNPPYFNSTSSSSSTVIPIIVLSKASNIEIRDAIRRTWAFDRFFLHHTVEIQVFFLVGFDDLSSQRIRAEQRLFNDVIHVSIPEFDSFMAYKELSAMIWIRTYLTHARFYIKTEEDVIMNMQAIVDLLLPIIENVRNEDFIIGWFGKKHSVNRGTYQRFVNAILLATSIHLDYAMSLLYVITARAADQMLKILNEVEWIDLPGDPFVTGALRIAAQIQVKNLAIDNDKYRYRLATNSCTNAFKSNPTLLFCSPLIDSKSKRSTAIYFDIWNILFTENEQKMNS